MNPLDMAGTIKPKSDQLNADDLITGPLTVGISGVRVVQGDQPCILDLDSPDLQPFKPCKTMRRLLILAWGNDGNQWVGKSMTIYRDESVKWAGKAIGGVRISHMSDIPAAQTHMLTATRGKREQYTVQPLAIDYTAVIQQFTAIDTQEKKDAMWANLTPPQQIAINNSINGVK